jgi:hypothetical protein
MEKGEKWYKSRCKWPEMHSNAFRALNTDEGFIRSLVKKRNKLIENETGELMESALRD